MARAAAYVIALGTFLWFGAKNLDLSGNVTAAVPFHSTNAYFESLTHSRAASERILGLLSLLPANRPVGVVYSTDRDGDTFLAFAITYLAWPKPVQHFPLAVENVAPHVSDSESAPVSGLFFCGIEPPAGTEGVVRLGDRLFFAPRADPRLTVR